MPKRQAQTFYLGNHGLGTKSQDLGTWASCVEGPTEVRLSGGYECSITTKSDGAFVLNTKILDTRSDVTCSAICTN